MSEMKEHVTISLPAFIEMLDRIKTLEHELRDRDLKLARISETLRVMQLTPDILQAVDLDSVLVEREPIFYEPNNENIVIGFTINKNKEVI